MPYCDTKRRQAVKSVTDVDYLASKSTRFGLPFWWFWGMVIQKTGTIMQVLVMGAGVVGVSCAYYLAKKGAKVCVIERTDEVAQETSFGNTGQISAGYAGPWGAPGIPLKAVKWLFCKHAPLRIRFDGSRHQSGFLWQMYKNCAAKPYAKNKARMMPLAEYSRECIKTLREQEALQYEHKSQGLLQIFRNSSQLDILAHDLKVLDAYQVPYEVMDVQGLYRLEPALQFAQDPLAGGLHLPKDETGDCHLFTQALADVCKRLGVRFCMQETITSAGIKGGRIDYIRTDKGTHHADCYVMALGSYSRNLGQALGLALPIYPVKGYSLTMEVLDDARVPRSTVVDELNKTFITRFDRRVRLGGTAQLSGYDMSLPHERRDTLERSYRGLFGGVNLAQGEFWTGLRPMTPDATPIIGKTPYPNLYTNTGHGSLGFTMACGSGAALSDLILGNTPDISLEGLGMSRYL